MSSDLYNHKQKKILQEITVKKDIMQDLSRTVASTQSLVRRQRFEAMGHYLAVV